MTVKDMVKKALENGKFEGLFTHDCGCALYDLMPCGEDCSGCKPGYRVKKANGDWITQADPPEKGAEDDRQD